MIMKINRNKSVGRVLFIVEGGKTEFSLLRRIFCNVLGYEYIEKRRGKAQLFKNNIISTSKIAVINTEESNISDICDENCYLDEIYNILITDYSFDVDNSAIYYIFDRDPCSNTDVTLIKSLLGKFQNAYENLDGNRGGLLLLSYPSIEAYIVAKFIDNAYLKQFSIGEQVKSYIATQNTIIQFNKISESTIIKASEEMFKYLYAENIYFDINHLGSISKDVFIKQEKNYIDKGLFNLVSLLSIAFIDLGIIELDVE